MNHGTRKRYLLGCDCRPCADANSAYMRGYRARRTAARDPQGTARARALETLAQRHADEYDALYPMALGELAGAA